MLENASDRIKETSLDRPAPILLCDHVTGWESSTIDTPFKTALSPLLENLILAYLQVLLALFVLPLALYFVI